MMNRQRSDTKKNYLIEEFKIINIDEVIKHNEMCILINWVNNTTIHIIEQLK